MIVRFSRNAFSIGIIALFGCFFFCFHAYAAKAAKKECLKNSDCIKYYENGKDAFKDEKWEKAIPYFQITLDEDENFTPAMIYLGVCLCKTEKQAEAHDYFNKVKEISPDSNEAEIADEWLISPDCQIPEKPKKTEDVEDELPLPGKETETQQDSTNICLHKNVLDLWSIEAQNRNWIHGWQGGNPSFIVDGDKGTSISTGYGRWGNEGEGQTLDVQSALGSTPNGISALQIDLENTYVLQSIAISRPQQAEGEGDGGISIMAVSVWASIDGNDWTRIVSPFSLLPASDRSRLILEEVPARYIRINLHSLGLYKWKGKTNSQLALSEVECHGEEYTNDKTDSDPKENEKDNE